MKCNRKIKIHQCRTCYNATKGLKLLTNYTKFYGLPHKKTYAELVTELSSINFMINAHKLPLYICGPCSKKLKAALSFIKQTQQVNEQLIALLDDEEEVDNELGCLQEAKVEIKMENDADYIADTKCFIKQEQLIPEDFLKTSFFDTDDMCEIKDDEKTDIIKDSAFKKNNTDLKLSTHDVENEKDVAHDTGTILNTEIYPLQASDDLDNTDKGSVGGVQEKQRNWRKNQERDFKKNNNKIEDDVEKPAQDYDVAVPCSQCNKIFANSKALTLHQRTSHIPENQKSICPLCFRKFSRSCSMYTHMRSFHGPDTIPFIRKPSTLERVFQCTKCPKNYTKKKHLNIHTKNKHSQDNEKSEKNTNTSEKNTENKICGNSNKPKGYEVRSLCSICGSSFSSKAHLTVHMRRHTGERPFKCDLCDRAYPRLSELTCHRRIHTGEKPFACKICGKTFRVSSKMTTHMRSHTDLRPYKCSQCERSFKYSKDLSIHFRIHTGERPYTCNVCDSTFTQSNTLKAHRVKLGHMDIVLENTNNSSG